MTFFSWNYSDNPARSNPSAIVTAGFVDLESQIAAGGESRRYIVPVLSRGLHANA